MRGFLEEQYQRAFRHDQWHIGIVDAPIQAFLRPIGELKVRWLVPPGPGKYYADPFGLRRGGATEMFFEEYDFRSNKGVISWVREGADGHFSRPRVAIELPVHASYPFLIEQDGSVYCVPETARAREITLFKAIEFPHRWTKAVTLVTGVAAVDSTVIKHNGSFWLFCTDLDDGPFSKLRIWHAPDLLGPWRPHAANPVKTDVASARPAGTPFLADGKLYRPAQDCTKTYGGAIALNRVTRLTTTEFEEERIGTIGPFWDGPHNRGIHTISSVGARTLIDGKRFAFNRWEMLRNLRESLEGRRPRDLARG